VRCRLGRNKRSFEFIWGESEEDPIKQNLGVATMRGRKVQARKGEFPEVGSRTGDQSLYAGSQLPAEILQRGSRTKDFTIVREFFVPEMGS